MNMTVSYHAANLISIVGLAVMLCGVASAQSKNIKNDTFWDTQDGKPIFSQGGGIFKFKDPDTNEEKYYWYGVHYELSERYRQDPSVTYDRGTGFKSVTCYSSVDLVNWTFEGDVLTGEETSQRAGRRGWGWLGLLGVAYIEEAGQYVLIIQRNNGVLFTVADEPTGPFKWHQYKDMTDTIGTPNTGDQTVFTDDETGKSYLVYSYGRGRNKIYISEVGVKDDKIDLLDCTQVYRGDGREGNCMFKHKGKYYLAASLLYGPGFNQWCPLSFNGDEPYFNSLNYWNLNVETGEWSVADDNNWVKNPSFEADRKSMPSSNKPVQERLLG